MPCRDDDRPREIENPETRRRLDAVTQMLCNVLDALETAEEPVRLEDLPKRTQAWWRAHKAVDATRIAAEAEDAKRKQAINDAREAAFAKLTPEDCAVLGLVARLR